jgi:spermidine synthase
MTQQGDFPILPFDAIPYVVRQRTRLQRLVSKEYHSLMEAEFATLEAHLPADAERILDIGGGMGGVDVFLSRHYGHKVAIEILDRVGMDETMLFGFRESTEKYNDPRLAQIYLREGGVPDENFSFWDADSGLGELKASGRRYDVILSLKSWCFHYPYATYEDLVRELLAPGGVMIVDLRVNKDQRAMVENSFECVATAQKDHASERLVFRHRG